MRVHLITAEDPLTLEARARELIVVFRPRHMTADQLLAGYEWAKTQFYSPLHILERLAKSRTGLWWNIPRNVGYMLGLTGEVRARAAMHVDVDRLAAHASDEELPIATGAAP